MNSQVKLHLGCGKRFLPGYVHIDLADFPHIDYKADIRKLDMFEDNTVDEIYACHCLEHFGRHEARDVLNEWRRVLCPGGRIYLAIPDFEAVCEHYREHQNMEILRGFLVGGQKNKYDYHYNVFDFESLKGVLEEIGFTDISRYDWNDFLPDGFDDYSRAYLPHMDFENGKLMSLNVTATKK
ncbi:MAG: methyltransferase domain-containing protein [Ruminococcus sp.]|jgi:predicted SAM-dependent methyltransferase|nr:methyltransferase domain-containing protein [Ruminococcus sp.]